MATYQYVKTDGTLGTTTDQANAPGIAPTSGFRTIADTTQPRLSGISNPISPPLYSSTPSIPTPQSPQIIDQFNQSLTQQLTTTKTQAQAEADRRAKEYETKIADLQKQADEYQELVDEGLADYKSTTAQQTREKQEALKLEKQRFDENYNANQALVGEMETLLTQGTQAIAAAKASPGMLLGGAREETARVTRDVTARVGVIQALLSARNGQMAVAQSQLNTTLNAVSSIYKDEIAYYTSIVDFYAGLKGEAKTEIADLTKEQKVYLDAKLISLNEDVANAQATAEMIRKAMMDPDTAYAYNRAGVSLSDTPEQINEKLAALGDPKLAGGSAASFGEQLYAGLTSATATAVRSRVTKFASEPLVQNFATIQDGYNFASSIDTKTQNPADDQALIYSLAKALDPGSVVREGEYATAQKYAQSWVAAYGKAVTQAIAGTGFLSEQARANIKKVIEQKYIASKKSYDQLLSSYTTGINALTGRDTGSQFLTDYVTPNEAKYEPGSTIEHDGILYLVGDDGETLIGIGNVAT